MRNAVGYYASSPAATRPTRMQPQPRRRSRTSTPSQPNATTPAGNASRRAKRVLRADEPAPEPIATRLAPEPLRSAGSRLARQHRIADARAIVVAAAVGCIVALCIVLWWRP